MTQKLITPDIMDCAICGSVATCRDVNLTWEYKVYCKANHAHNLYGLCHTAHRAICRWNNVQKKILEERRDYFELMI